MEANRQKMKIFQGSESWVVPMENIFCLVWGFGLELEVGIPWPIFSNFTMWYISPALKNSCIWGIRVLFLNLKNSRFSWPDLRGVHITNNLKNSRFSLPDLPGIEWTLLIFSTAGPLAWLLIREWKLYKLSPENEKTVSITLIQVADLPNERFIWQFFSEASHCVFKQNRLKEKEFGKCLGQNYFWK